MYPNANHNPNSNRNRNPIPKPNPNRNPNLTPTLIEALAIVMSTIMYGKVKVAVKATTQGDHIGWKSWKAWKGWKIIYFFQLVAGKAGNLDFF